MAVIDTENGMRNVIRRAKLDRFEPGATVAGSTFKSTNVQDAIDEVGAAAGGGGGITDAPSDGTTYGRNNAAWVNVAPLNSPTLTGTPAAPTAAPGTNTTQIATTAFVVSAVGTPGVIPENSEIVNYTTVLSDAGKFIFHPSTDNNARTFTIDSNANVAFPVGTVISFVNMINTVTIAIAADTMTLAGTGTTGSRTLAANGTCTALKVGTTSWIISGTNLT